MVISRLRRIRREGGFTLTELVIVLSLLGFVVSMAYAGIDVVRNANTLANRQSNFVSDVVFPLNFLSKLVMQNATIESADPYGMTFLTDMDSDNLFERNIVSLSGSDLDLVQYNTDLSRVNTTQRLNLHFSTHNSNRAHSESLFRYYTRGGAQITDMASVQASATAAAIKVMADFDGRTLEDTVSVNFRNRSGG